MIITVYLLAILALMLLAFTRHRILVISGFYLIYGTLKVLAMGDVLDLGQTILFRVVYLALFLSVLIRLLKDREFIGRINRGPLFSYFIIIFLFLSSALYSRSTHSFMAGDPSNVWAFLLIYSLFWLAAAQVHSLNDVAVFSWATVLVSVTLSTWVIWNAATLNFEVLRGGIEVNQNFVSVFVLIGAVALVYKVIIQKGLGKKMLLMTLLLPLALSSFILASRGTLAAFLAAIVIMLFLFSSTRGYKSIVALTLAVAVIFGITLMLPGGTGILERVQEAGAGNINARPQIWTYSLHYFAEAGPLRMLFGNGYSSASVILSPVFTDDMWNYHNEFVYRLMDQGLVGLSAFLIFIFCIGRNTYRTGLPLRNLMIGWLVLLVGAGLTSTIADSHPFWILTGIMTGASSAVPQAGTVNPGTAPMFSRQYSGS